MSFEMLSDLGIKKYEMCRDEPGRFFARAIVAGLYLGIATILSVTLGTLLFQNNLIASKIAVAGSFGIGLVIIVILGSELFTGNCFTTMIPIYGKKLKFRQIIPMWIICYIGNFIGISLVCFLFVKSGSNHDLFIPYIESIVSGKLTFNVGELFIKGVLCNFIVCVGTYVGMKMQDDTAKTIIMMIIVMAFVLPGFEHSIANMGYFRKKCEELGIDENTSTQLDWISMKSKYKVLFYDGNQTIKGSDISKDKMDKLIEENSDKCYFLTTQLRCKSGELFLDNIDQLFKCSLKNKIESSKDFEIKVFDNPNEMIDKIKQLDKKIGLCRNVAGYDWEWKSKDKSIEEIRKKDLYDFNFEGKKYIWNHTRAGWILSSNAVNEIGCVHTVQGYDLNYVGVIIGPDLSYNKEKNKIEVHIDELKDKNVKRGTDEKTVQEYIINTYKVLLERGIKGCYIYACDESMQEYLKEHIETYSSN